MRLTPSLNKVLRAIGYAVALMLAATIFVTTVYAASPSQWAEGWSREQGVILGNPHYGHLTAPAGQDNAWLVTVGERSGKTQLQITLYNLARGSILHNEAIPITYIKNGFAIQETARGLTLIWVEREEGVESTVHRAFFDSDGTLLGQSVIWRTPALVEAPSLAEGDDGTVYIALSAALEGHHAIHLLTLRGEANPVTVTRLTPQDELANLPSIAAAGNKLHLVFYRHQQQFSWAEYHLYDLPTLIRASSSYLGPLPQGHDVPPTLLANLDGSVTLVWQRMVGTPARVIPLEPALGRLSNGNWLEPLTPVSSFAGSTLSPRGARGTDGSMLIATMVQLGQTWQVKSVLRDSGGNTVRSGYSTMTPGNALNARPLLIGGTAMVSFYSFNEEQQAELFIVQTATPAKQSLAYRIGLSPHSPWADAFYKYISLITGAFFLAFGATGAVTIALLAIWLLSRLGLFSATTFGNYLRIALLFAIIAYFKQPDSLLYFGAVMLPGIAAVVSFAAAATLALAVVRLADLATDDFITLSLLALLFVTADLFTSLFIAGVGVW